MAFDDARPVPKRNQAYRHYFSIRDKEGNLVTGWDTPVATRSLDGAAHAAAATPVEIATNSGTGYIDLTAAEMNTDCTVVIIGVSNTDAVAYVVALFPEETGDINSNLTAVLGTAVGPELNGKVADGFTYFFDVATPGKTMNDAGSGTISLPQTFFAISDDNQADAGDYTNTQAYDQSYMTRLGNATNMILDFSVGSGNEPFEFNLVVVCSSGGGARFGSWEAWDFTNTQWRELVALPNTETEETYTVRAGGLPAGTSMADYVDGTGSVRYRFVTPNHGSGQVDVDLANVICITEQGSVPTPTEIAIAVDAQQSSTHGAGNWEGDYSNAIGIESVTSQTEFVLSRSIGGVLPGMFLLVYNAANKASATAFAGEYITNYQEDTPVPGQATVTIAEALSFTVTDSMIAQLRINPPVIVDAIGNTLITDDAGASLNAFFDVNPTTTRTVDTLFDPSSDTVDMGAINGSAAAAVALALSANEMRVGAVDATVAPTQTVFESSDITEPNADHWQPSLILFTSGALKGHRANVTAYSLNAGRGRFTVDSMPTSPAGGDSFIIV